MGLLTEKYMAWAKYPQNYTAEQVLNQIVVDLQWLEEEQAKNCSIPAVVGRSEQLKAFVDFCEKEYALFIPSWLIDAYEKSL